jgi:3(or 17)beta-hydroxysteroid dehydrogenase
MMDRVAGKVALVTGAAMGLGFADAEILIREGASVALTDINGSAGRDAAARLGPRATFFRHDVSSEADWQRVVAATVAQFGGIDILVNNAGVVVVADLEQTTLEQFRFVNSIMSEGVFLGCKTVLPEMAKRTSGSIINMSSTAALLGYPMLIAYSAAKGAVRSMTKSVAMHCQEKGYRIRCNALHPGSIETPMVQSARGRPGQAQIIPDGVLPPDAIGAPSDVANMVLYLASDESRFITGQEFVIDNGLMVRP